MKKICLSCENEFNARRAVYKYCNNKCQQDFQYRQFIKEWLTGLKSGCSGKTKQISKYIRRYLHETRGTACEECGWDKRHPVDNAVLTEIEHIDGNAENNLLSNLKVLCPNCHSMTPTFRARNKNSTRERK